MKHRYEERDKLTYHISLTPAAVFVFEGAGKTFFSE